ncbi:aminopeptidase Q-like [Belonocnema kinseyi]|uniref:aminopeptidase Q-like n=1 Tax=Belonocnema kinseyi TaxID=2817044 RepID=UPI00143D8672|nr:aminopeptidase Q-like [Belonocnema kinseyi]XP_033224299.1 aminopeptidase Q-like [Belonocnema kinseyi]
MGYLGFSILLLGLVHLSHQINYRLPNGSIPHHYKLSFIPHLIPDNFTFDGESEIFLRVHKTTRNLTLHSLNLEIHEESTMIVGDEEIIIPHRHIFEKEREFFILNLRNDLLPGDYKLLLKFSGILNNASRGFFWDSYLNDDNETTYLVATQFETTHARQAFPCWDEPALKATFEISIKHFPNYTALSNMPVDKKLIGTESDGKLWTKFKTTPLMSTYLVCFTVSDFQNITNLEGNFSLWARKNVLNSMKFAYDVALKAFPVLEDYTNIPYILPKMDIIAIPGHDNGAMENWGLIVAKESDISRQAMFDESFLRIQKYMVHEVSHQWFGNLISVAWWNDIWLTEGLASYFHFYLGAKVNNFPRMTDLFIINKNKVFEKDDDPLSLPPFREVNSAIETRQLLNTVHDKASTIMKMLSGLLSEEVFQSGIKKLLKKYKFRSITTDNFWETMQETLNESSENNFKIKKMLEPYISQQGFPLINVIRNYTSGVIKLTQECLMCKKNNLPESKWWIPINFATTSSPDFSSTLATHWMNPEDEFVIEGVDPNDWIIINIKSSAYYRVNYDEENWKKIGHYLNSENFSNIDILNRAQILQDGFWLFKQEKLDKELLIYLTSYLTREVDYIPWSTGDDIIQHLVENTDITEDSKIFILAIVGNLVDDAGLEESPNDDLFTVWKRFIGIYWSCYVSKRFCSHLRW